MKGLTETERQEIREAHIFYNAQGVPILDDHVEKALDSERVAWSEIERLRNALEEASKEYMYGQGTGTQVARRMYKILSLAIEEKV
ncbi:hypothetical protein M2277_000842 [Paenibacillus sp. LBL]|uniref:hypothetical protein n=1 Tax=Paenibacillus sp. LBL TaxID=2940563 RepID=UPI0024765C6E|nr:hypothetical protein [Paenibacillus sp. LBL]MDH6670198.1 hypothetical protein [Paenibacillus sp. LBL]